MNTKLLCVVAMTFAANVSYASLQPPESLKPGVWSTKITRTQLSDSDIKRLSKVKMATADVYAGTQDISLQVNQHGTVRSTHSVCFETLFTTEADYMFDLNVGGISNTLRDHIVIMARQRTCVENQLYKDVNFSSPGNYAFYAISSGTTQMAGEKRTTSRGNISVR
jgi:hypothetical protein